MKIDNIEKVQDLIKEREDLLGVRKTMLGKSCHFMSLPHYGADGFNNGVHIDPNLNERFMMIVEIEEELKQL